MYQNSVFLQIISLVCLCGAVIFLVISLIPWMGFEEEMGTKEANAVRIVAVILILGLLRGAL